MINKSARNTLVAQECNYPQVSVIIPAYNSARFLPEAIDSVLNQTYPVFEIIVVDDGSTDNTKEVCQRYPTVQYIYQNNQGIVGARNTGFYASTGEYLVFFDSDDCLLPNAVEIGINAIKEHPEVGFVFGNYELQLMNPDGSYTTEEIYDNHKEVANYENILAGKLKIQVACVLFRRTAVESVGGFDPNAKAAEDYNLFLRIARDFPIHFHGQKVFEYRYNGGNISGKPTYLINTIRCHSLQWSYIEQTGNKKYIEAYEQGRQAWIKIFIDRLPYEIIKYLEAGQWVEALGLLRLILNYDPKLNFIDQDIYNSCYSAIISQLRKLPVESSLAYWKQQLAGVAPLLSLPTDRPRPAEQSFLGSDQSFVISQELTAELNFLSQQENVSLFMTLLAAFDTLLYRYTGTEDIIVGSPFTNYEHSEVFVNAVVLRTDMSGNPSFQTLLQRVRKVASEADSHKKVPYCLLLEELNPPRDLSYSPFFQVLFVIEEDICLEKIELSSLTASPWVLENNAGKFDVILFLKLTNNGLQGKWIYNTDLFDAETIDRLNGHFQTLLEGIIANPQQPISELPILTPQEKQQLLIDWNNTYSDYSQDKCLHQLFAEQVEVTPDAVAVVFADQQLTYRELNSRANRLAHHLLSLGVKPDQLVGICIERSLEMVIGLLGILKAGGVYVPLDPAYPTERLSYMISHSQMRVLVTQQDLISLIPEHEAKVVCLDSDWADISQASDENPCSGVTVENLAYVIYTSGSTGKPKGVQLPHRAVTNFLYTMAIKPGLTANDVLLAITTISFDIAVLELYLPLILGAKVVLVSREVAVDGIKLLKLIQDSQATVMQATPATWQLLLATGWSGKSQLKVLCGGEALSPQLASQMLERVASVWNMYGPTEATVWATTYELKSSTQLDNYKPAILIGKPIGNTETYILDQYFQPVPIGVRGELYIGGVCLAKGYLHREDLTSERFIPHPFSDQPNARIYRTGDVAKYLPNGDIEYISRIDNQVKIRGFRIELGEIEVLLAKHPGIRQLAVIVREDIPGDKRIVAYIVSHEHQTITVNDLRSFLAQNLPQYMIPSAFVTLEALPLTPNGKVDRKALLSFSAPNTKVKIEREDITTPKIGDGEFKTDSTISPNETQKILTNIWQEVLKIDDIGIHDNFFELGGHSLLMAQLRNKVEEILGLQISIVEVFQYPTIQTLSKYLGNRNQGQEQNSKYKSNSNLREQTASADFTKDIAIIGMAGRFPGSANINKFWHNLLNGVESIAQLSDDELKLAGVDPKLLNDPNYVKVAAIIPKVEEFDASFFGYSPREAQVIDPQQRLYLECAWEALENAGYQPDSDDYTIGVYGGVAPSTYLLNNILQNSDLAEGRLIDSASWLQAFIGNSGDFLTTRVAYKLNLTGPAINVQTGCSTSLVAVHMACQSLLKGECDIALAGGVSLQHKTGYIYEEGMIFSPDGHCHAFDAAAKGIVSGDGVGIVVLKPLKQAIADGDYIYATIKGSAINNDGNLKVGYTAPGVDGQAAVIAAAQRDAGVDPETITYVETHGTGTPLGDPIEIAGLTQAFRTKTDRKGYCAIGSVKSNIGHLNTAAGVTSLIKTALALKHQQIPPSLNFEQPNPEIDFANSPFYVNTKLSKWESKGSPRRAGVSSFGFGGTNAHAVLEEWDDALQKSKVKSQKSKELLVISAKTASALDTATINLATHLKQNPEINLADVAYTLSIGRVGFNHRRIVVASEIEDAVNTLNTVEKKRVFTNSGTVKPRSVVFMFSGQGSQYVNMARELYETEAYFQEQVDLCCEILQPHLGFDLRDVLYPSAEEIETATAKLTQTATTQPALFVIGYAISQIWMKWGITPVAMIGHSIGEYVAATLAGVFSLEDALALVAARGQLMQSMAPGSMLAVPLPENEVQPLLAGTSLQIAVINSPSNCVVSGTTAAIEAFAKELAEKGIEGRPLHTSHAFHSQMMEEILAPFTDKVKQIRLNAPAIPFVSNVTGTWITVEDATNPSYYAQHLRQAVRFADGVKQFFDNPEQILLEVGPGRTLSTLAKRHPDKPSEQITLTSVRHPQDEYSDVSFILNNLGQMWLAGLEVNWSAFYGEQKYYRVPLPTYPFERKRYWIEPTKKTTETKLDEGKKPDIADWFYVPTWKQSFNIPTAKIQSPILVFVDECGLGSQLVAELESRKLEVVKVAIGEKFTHLDHNYYSIDPCQSSDYDSLLQELVKSNISPKTILHLWNVTANQEIKLTVDLTEEQQDISFYSLLYLMQALGKQNMIDEMKILVISNHLQNVNDEEILNPAKSTLMGPVLVISQENYQVECRSIDIVLSETGSQREKKIIGQLLQEIQIKSTDKAIAYRGNHRWVQSFEPVRLELPTSETPRLRMGGVYLITGGLGEIGLVLATHLAKTVQAKLILTGRTVLPERDQWQEWLANHSEENSTSDKIRKVQELEALGAEVLVVQADVANLQQMERAIATSQHHFGQINGVIHAAGVVDQQAFPPINKTSKAIINQHFSAKISGTLVLSQLLSESSVDFYLMMSSISTVLGGLGYIAYAAASHFLNAWTHQQNQNSSTSWISINWDLWKVGQFEQNGSLVNLTILPEEGMNAMTRIFAADIFDQVVISTGGLQPRIDKSVKLVSLQNNDSESLHTELSETNTIASTQLEQTIIKIWEQVLGVDNIGLDDNFFELGGDSLVAVQLLSKLRKNLDPKIVSGLELSLRQLFKTPTIGELLATIETTDKQVPNVSQSLTIFPRTNKDSSPLSFPQQRVWFLEQLDPNRADYHINQACYLRGCLDLTILQKALDAIVARNEVLRTNFVTDIEGNPIQIIGQPRPIDIAIYDLPNCLEAEQENAVENWIEQEKKCSFNLATDLMIRAKLLRITPQNYVLLLITHHIASDGSSVGLLWKQLNALYEAFINNHSNPLPEISIQYADFAVWQRQWLSGEELDQQLQYWQKQLAGATPVLEIPTDYPRPAIQSYTESGRQSLRLSPTLSKSFKLFSRQQEATLFISMLAAFQILLYRYSGQEDIIVGSPSAGRNQPEIAELIGFFINTLVLRGDLSGNPSFKELLAQVRETALGAYSNQATPFEKLVQELEIKRDLSRNPLFQVWFNMLNFEEEKIILPGLIAESLFIPESSKFDFSLYVKDQEQGIDLVLVYKPNLFAPERMREMLYQFEALLTQIVAEPEKSIHSYSLVTANSQALLPNPSQILPQPEYQPITHIFTDWATRTPQQPAIIQNERVWHYQELAQASTEIAQILITANIEKGDVVAVSGVRSFGLIASILGVLMSGGVLLNIDPNLPTARQELMLSTAVVKTVLFISEEVNNSFANSLSTITINPDTGKASLNSSSTTPVTVTLSPDDSAYIFFTSGTTGTPKGVLGCHKGLSHFLHWQRSTFEVTPQDRVAQLTGLSFDVVLRDIFLPLTSGATLCLPAVDDNLSAMRVLPWLERQQISLMHTVPTLIQSWLMDVPTGISLRSLRLLFSAGEPLTDTLVKQWRSAFPESGQIVNLYGPTETTLAKCYYPVPTNPLPGVQPIGSPLPQTQALIFTPDNQLCGIGEIGEIVFRTPFRTKGYINADQGQLSKFAKNPFRDDDTDLIYYTGDRGRYRLDGTLEILGRIDQQVKIRGVRIEPGEISATINQNPLIKASLVIAREDIPGDKCLVAYVVPNSQDLNTSELRQFLKQRLPDYMIPSAFLTLEALPVTANGKIDKRALPAPSKDQQQSEQAFVAPHNDIEKQLVAIWEKVLGVQPIGITDNFFELGGHSLLAIRLFAEIEHNLGKNLPLVTLFQAQTVEELAGVMAAETSPLEQESLVIIQPGIPSKPPLFCVHAIWGNVFFYQNLARHLEPEQPFYALQSRGLDGKQPPLTSVYEMATRYVQEIQKIQPHGPYFLGGFSLGSTIALEMAQQLRKQGEEIALFAVFDQPSPNYTNKVNSAHADAKPKTLSQQIFSHLKNLMSLKPQEQFNYIQGRVNWHLTVGKASTFYKLYLRYIQRSLPDVRLLEVAWANAQARKNYTVQTYPGKVTLFRASGSIQKFEDDFLKGWGEIATDGVETYEIPGATHTTIMQEPNVKLLAEKLTVCLEKTQINHAYVINLVESN